MDCTFPPPGPDTMSEQQLVSAVLGGTPPEDDLARRLLARFGSLRQLRSAGPGLWLRVAGMNGPLAQQLAAALALADRTQTAESAAALKGPGDSRRYFEARLGSRRRESFACLYLDTRHRPISFQILFQGTIDSAAVYPREVLRHCLERDASAVIVGHNHPSGELTPSAADHSLTQRLRQALALLDIRLLDHLIVASGASHSMAEHGQL
ncbi:MAG: DNA repair protein RadC [Pseudomonadota bacterium]